MASPDENHAATMTNIDWNAVTRDDLPEMLREIADAQGMSVVKYLVETFGGTTLYVPSLASLRQVFRKQQILALQGKRDVRQIARRFGVSGRHVRKVFRDGAHAGNGRHVENGRLARDES